MVGYHIDSLWKSPNDSRTARCVPPRMWSRAWDIQVFCLSLWRTVIASSIPILSLPDISFPPIYWGGGAEAKQKHPPLTLLVLSNPVYLLPVLFFFFKPNWSFTSYSLSLFPWSPPNLLLPNAPTSLPVPRSLCHFHFLSWLCCFNNVD